jgi:hypothetical protein
MLVPSVLIASKLAIRLLNQRPFQKVSAADGMPMSAERQRLRACSNVSSAKEAPDVDPGLRGLSNHYHFFSN